jgi:hypothetical protein
LVGGIDNAANLIIELCEIPIDFSALVAFAELYPTSAIRRLGFLLEHFTDIEEVGRGAEDSSVLLRCYHDSK